MSNCKTCNKAGNLCLTCVEAYPYLLSSSKGCTNNCVTNDPGSILADGKC